MTDFSVQSMIEMIAQVMFAGDTNLAGLFILIAIFLTVTIILASLRAPVTYAVVPMIPLAILFAAMEIMDASIAFIIVIISAIVTALEARRVILD